MARGIACPSPDFASAAGPETGGAGRPIACTRSSQPAAPRAAAASCSPRSAALTRASSPTARTAPGVPHRHSRGAYPALAPAVVGRVGGVPSGSEGSACAEFHGTWNRRWWLTRNKPPLLMIVAPPGHLFVLAYVRLRSPGRLKVRMRALGQALKGLREAWPTGPWLRPVAALTVLLSWSPLSLSRHAVVTQPSSR